MHSRGRPESHRRGWRAARWRLSALGGIFLLLATFGVVSVSTSPDAEAALANPVTSQGRYAESINWFEWDSFSLNQLQNLAVNGSATAWSQTTIPMADRFLRTQCTFTKRAVQGNTVLSYATPGNWSAFDELYDTQANVALQLRNNVNAIGYVRFEFSCGTYLMNTATETNVSAGVAVPLQGLVFADAESNNWLTGGQQEYIEARPLQTGTTWHLVDSLRNAGCTTSSVATVSSTISGGIRFRSNGAQCRNWDQPATYYGPASVLFMKGSSSAEVVLASNNGSSGGETAMAIGTVVTADFGDAPLSFGNAGSLIQPDWAGGVVAPTAFGGGATVNLTTMRTNNSVGVAGDAVPRLGDTIDSEPAYPSSPGVLANVDDLTGIDDEDGVAVPSGGYYAQPGSTVTQVVSCAVASSGAGQIAGWIDWNLNGVFDAAEKSNQVQCPASGNATLTWTVPNDAKRAVHSEGRGTYLRVRISNDRVDGGTTGEFVSLQPTGMTTTGEVEDYYVDVRGPAITLNKVVVDRFGRTVPASWTLQAAPQSIPNQPTISGNGDAASSDGVSGELVRPGTYRLGESLSEVPGVSAGDYVASSWTCTATTSDGVTSSLPVDANGDIVVSSNDISVNCTVINTAKPTLRLVKNVDQNGTGSATAANQWTLTGTPSGITGQPTVSGDGGTGTTPVLVLPGHYDLSEAPASGASAGLSDAYAAGSWTCVDGGGATVPVSSSAQITLLNQDVTCSITNTAKLGSAAWAKTDEDGSTRLAGSEWNLSGPDGYSQTITDNTGQPGYTGLDTDTAVGQFHVADLPWGQYTLTETTPPPGYEAGEALASRTVGLGSLDVAFTSDGQSTIVNTRISGSVSWSKAAADVSPVEYLSGSEWTLTGQGLPDEGVVVTDCIVAGNCGEGPYEDQEPGPGQFRLEGLTLGTYTLVEHRAPAGYKVDPQGRSFTITADGRNFSFGDPFLNHQQDVPTLPLTGGMSSQSFIVLGGGLLMLAGLAGLIHRRRSAAATRI